MTFSFEKKLILLFFIIIVGVIIAGITTYRINKTEEGAQHLAQLAHEASPNWKKNNLQVKIFNPNFAAVKS